MRLMIPVYSILYKYRGRYIYTPPFGIYKHPFRKSSSPTRRRIKFIWNRTIFGSMLSFDPSGLRSLSDDLGWCGDCFRVRLRVRFNKGVDVYLLITSELKIYSCDSVSSGKMLTLVRTRTTSRTWLVVVQLEVLVLVPGRADGSWTKSDITLLVGK